MLEGDGALGFYHGEPLDKLTRTAGGNSTSMHNPIVISSTGTKLSQKLLILVKKQQSNQQKNLLNNSKTMMFDTHKPLVTLWPASPAGKY